MVPGDYSKKLLGLARAIHRWLGALATLDTKRRDRVGRYADEIATTLQRATDALVRLESDPADRTAQRALTRELGRIGGYIETIVEVLDQQLDGRKLAGIKRRLEQLASQDAAPGPQPMAIDRARLERLLAAEGYFRALADGLRA
jgi:hypothetical protein